MSGGIGAPPDAPGNELENEAECVVALFDFDPSQIEWPFRQQRPLPLQRGAVIQVIHDDGNDWVLGRLVGSDNLRGYFPKNYTIPSEEYRKAYREYQDAEVVDELAPVPEQSGTEFRPSDRETTIIPDSPPGEVSSLAQRPSRLDDVHEDDISEEQDELHALRSGPDGLLGLVDEPGLASGPLVSLSPSAFDASMHKAPHVPMKVPRGQMQTEDMSAALVEVQRDARELALDPGYSASQSDTPRTQPGMRPERDYIRRHIPMDLQDRYKKKLSELHEIVNPNVKVKISDTPAFPLDSRVRATTCRATRFLQPPHLRIALARGARAGARWVQMFRPGFNDFVNESFKNGCNACVLSELYLTNSQAREMFQRLHVQDTHGTMWFELQRRKQYLFYQRMDFVDVMMWHPDAWGFPDTSLSVSALPGNPYDPMHGWFYQGEISADKAMDDVEFCYNVRERKFPENTFQALALGKVPDWIKAAGGFGLDEEDEDEEDKDEEAEQLVAPQATSKARGKTVALDFKTLLDKAGIGRGEDEYVYVEEQQRRAQTLGPNFENPPEVLDHKQHTYRIQGLPGMRIFLRGRMKQDNTRLLTANPKVVKDMAAQLGIVGQCASYWYCLFALRYPLAPDWEVFVKNDTRWYLHLPTNKIQVLHPMIRRFREHMHDCLTNEFLWDFRSSNMMKCSECGQPDAVVWCMQCTDYFCTACFFKTHTSERGKRHQPMPIPGCRYLLRTEVERLREHMPLLNVGFSNRRRFLATGNQSDKNGSRSGDTWLFFEADTFSSALVQAPRKHWYLKRLNPPRLAPDAEGYYYNFASDVLADEPTHIMSKQHQQKALSLLQKNIRGAITRRRINREVESARVIQKCKKMWDAKKMYGEDGKNREVLQGWYRRFRARLDRQKLEFRVTRCQAIVRGMVGRKFVREQQQGITSFQAHFRGLRGRRHAEMMRRAATNIQRMYRGHLMGRKPMHDMHSQCSRLQGLARGVAYREGVRRCAKNATYIQAHWRGVQGRRFVLKMRASGLLIQRNWRRFQAQLDVKIMLYDRLDILRVKCEETLRLKIQESSATIIQRSWRKHVDSQQVVFMKREKFEADKRIQTLLVAVYVAAGALRHHVHPWWRHLPPGLRDVLEQIKGSLQRTIALVPVSGKIANEEIGRKGLRVAGKEHLTYVQPQNDPDLASHLFISITRHLLSLVPEQQFPTTLKWACYAISHNAARLAGVKGQFAKETVNWQKEHPPDATEGDRDTLYRLWDDTGRIKHHHDYLMSYPDESAPGLILYGLPHTDPTNLRQVFLTAQVLITMRQYLDTPTLSTEDHLKFQGLDAKSGAHVMDVLASELDHRLPQELPQKNGNVAALSKQIADHVNNLKLETDKKEPAKKAKVIAKKLTKPDPKSKAGGKAKAKGKSKASNAPSVRSSTSGKVGSESEKGDDSKATLPIDIETSGTLYHFSRNAMFRVVQQVGYFMRDQQQLVDVVLAAERKEDPPENGLSVRQTRYVSVTDKLFELADNEKHDHCSFVLAVVLYHMAMRALCLRLMYHRAAVAIQKRYRYIKQKGAKVHTLGPAMLIQKAWRGCRVALHIMYRDSAAAKIQHSYKVYRWNRRANILLEATLRIQRVWLGAIHRKWLRHCNISATYIQKIVRATQVRLALDKAGREIARPFQIEMNQLLKTKGSMTESEYGARTGQIVGKMRSQLHKHRQNNIEERRMQTLAVRSEIDKSMRLAMKGAVQPMRISPFEPMVFALAKMDPKLPPRYGAQKSRVLDLVTEAKKEIDKTLPREVVRRVHAAAKRGRAAVIVRRLAKATRPKPGQDGSGGIDDDMFVTWSKQQFEPKRF